MLRLDFFDVSSSRHFVMADGNDVQARKAAPISPQQKMPFLLALSSHHNNSTTATPVRLTSSPAPRSSPSYSPRPFSHPLVFISPNVMYLGNPRMSSHVGKTFHPVVPAKFRTDCRLTFAHGDSQFHQHEALMTPRAPRTEMLAIRASR